ncbi:MAG TPA: PepSY domain-containing protein [Ignavibacteriaceae bacterium]
MILNLYGKILIAGFVIIGSVVLYSCSCSCTDSESNVPDPVLKNSNEFVISKVGKDFFDKNIKPDFQETKKIGSNYYMVYSFKMPDKPYVDTKIKFTVDTTGQITDKENIAGLPDCISNLGKCSFNIDEEQAKKIALDNDFKEGIKDWKVEFKWEPKYKQYVWSILSTFEESQGSFGFRGNGEILLIDPDSGEIISQDKWRVM